MTNNDILRRLRYCFNFNDDKMMSLYKHSGESAERSQLSSWLKKEDDSDFEYLGDKNLAIFLNGLIIEKRGQKEGVTMVAESTLTNNLVLIKLKIALNLKAEEILEILDSVDFRLSKPELSAFFRKPGHKHYRTCKDQIVRNFLHGLQIKLRPKD
jgi:uncharacterized protein YehS (DUF1456 family)